MPRAVRPGDEDRYRLLIDSIADYAIYMLDPTGIVTSWNPGAERFKGYVAEEIIGQHFSRFYTEEDKAAGLPARALATAAKEGRFESEGWRMRKDGRRFWANVVIDPVRAPDGTIIGFAKVTRDLTERRATEEALRQSEEQFRLMVQGVSDYAIYRLDLEGLVSSWNLGAERIKGYRPNEIIGRSFAEFYTPEDQASGLPARGLATAAKEGRFEAEGWRMRKDGTRFRAHVIIDAIHDEAGNLTGFAKITRDITERDTAQRQLEAAREALFQAQKLEAIGQLTGGVAHDFNNLLMAITGSLELVRKRLPEDPKITPLIDNALMGAQRGATLTQRMLSFARRQAMKTEVVDVEALVRGMEGLIERSVGSGITVRLDFPANLPPIETDALQLETAILNLAVNARDAMLGEGALRLWADWLPAESAKIHPNGFVRLCVEDTGVGMDAETATRAVEPFFTTKGVGRGTGLGLSMVNGLVEQSGGRLTIDSEPGGGARVELRFPACTGSAQPVEAQAAPSPSVSGRPLSILAVDDDVLVLMNTAALLEDLGHQVTEAESVAEALEHLEARPFDLVITDQVMPGATGLELVALIRERWPDLPVILATGYAELPAEIGATLHQITKPFMQHDLVKALAKVMPASRALAD